MKYDTTLATILFRRFDDLPALDPRGHFLVFEHELGFQEATGMNPHTLARVICFTSPTEERKFFVLSKIVGKGVLRFRKKE